jgi:hypothetical protein
MQLPEFFGSAFISKLKYENPIQKLFLREGVSAIGGKVVAGLK